MIDKVTAIAQLVTVLAQLGAEEFGHIWMVIHAVKGSGVKAAPLVMKAGVPPMPVIPDTAG